MLRTGKHPTTGVKSTEAERANAVLMLYTLALQPFVGAWAMSKIPQSAEKVPEVKKTELNINWEAKQPVSGEQWNSYFKEKYGAENVQWKTPVKSVSQIMDIPSVLWNTNPNDIAEMMKKEGWTVTTLKKGDSANSPYLEGGGYSMNPPVGSSGSSQCIQYYPGGGRHGDRTHYKMSKPNSFTIRIFSDGRYEIETEPSINYYIGGN